MILRAEFVSGANVIMEESTVIDDAGDNLNIIFAGCGKTKSAGPRLQRVQNDHGPINQRAELLETVDEIKREAVGRTGSDSDAVSQAGFFQ